MRNVNEEEIEKDWKEFWEPIVGNDLELIKKELYDYHYIMNSAAKVYFTVTDGATSNLMVYPEVIESLFSEYVQKLIDEAIEDYKEEHEGPEADNK
jgi:hypothetical protein